MKDYITLLILHWLEYLFTGRTVKVIIKFTEQLLVAEYNHQKVSLLL